MEMVVEAVEASEDLAEAEADSGSSSRTSGAFYMAACHSTPKEGWSTGSCPAREWQRRRIPRCRA